MQFYFLVCNISDAPATPSDASRTINGTEPYTLGESLSYTCNLPSYALNSSVVFCQSDGNWLPSSLGSCMQVTSKFSATIFL